MDANACPACGSRRLGSALATGESRYARCRSCATLFDPDPPAGDEIRELYRGPDYYVKEAAAERSTLWGYAEDYIGDRENIEAKFDMVLGHVERYAPVGRLLDVGSGPGFLLTAARRRGWEARGIDFNEWAAGFGREQLGVDVRVEELSSIAAESPQAFEAVTMMDLIEHSPEPGELIADAARVLRPEGCLALLTPDAGSPISRALGARWPEVRRPGEHTVLFSIAGLTALLRRHGLSASGWHSIGKRTSLGGLVSDVGPAVPGLASLARRALGDGRLSERTVDVDPHTKFCLYARRVPGRGRVARHRPARVPKAPERLATVDAAILDELEALADAERFCDWMFDQFGDHVGGAVAEVGAGIGTFSQRLLDRGARSLLLLEPDPTCARALADRFGSDPRVTLAQEALPEAPSLAPDLHDLVVCQNVLEHVGDDGSALETMAQSLRPGGHLALVVPASPKLFGALDDAYGHWRRYTPEEVEGLIADAGLEPVRVRPINALGVVGWWLNKHRPGARIGPASLRAYELLVRAWRPVEDRRPLGFGLSVVCLARRPRADAG